MKAILIMAACAALSACAQPQNVEAPKDVTTTDFFTSQPGQSIFPM